MGGFAEKRCAPVDITHLQIEDIFRGGGRIQHVSACVAPPAPFQHDVRALGLALGIAATREAAICGCERVHMALDLNPDTNPPPRQG